MPETTVTITAVDTKSGTNAKGPWTMWKVKDHQGTAYMTFVEGQGTLAQGLIGKSAKIAYSESDKGKRIQSIAGDDSPPAAPVKPGAQGEAKDVQIVRQVAWKAAVELAKTIEGSWGPDQLFTHTSKLAHAIEHDIYRTTPQPAKDETDDIPF